MSTLKNKTVSALLWDFLGTFSTQGGSFILTILLARILSPEDFGVVGMALVFIGLSQVFMDAGFSTALIQQKENDHLTYSSVFFFNIVLGCFLFLFFQLIAAWIANFYQIPEIEHIIRYLAFSIPLYALTVVQVSILKKELRFKELSLRMFLAGIISGIVGVVMAFYGFGVYALVAQSVLSSVVTTIVLWSVSEWRPTLAFSWEKLRNLLGFSKYVFFAQVFGQILSRLDTLVIGKMFSAATLGFFSRAESLNRLVVKYSSSSINRVFFPVLSKLQDDIERFNKVFFQAITVAASLTFLLSGICIFSGEAIIIGLFGEKWLPSVFIFQILMLRIFNYPINALIVNAFLALGKAKENFWHGNVRKLLKIGTLLVALYYSFEVFLYSIIAASYIGTFYNNIILSRLTNISFWKQISAIYKFALLFIIAALPAWYVYSYVPNMFVKTLLSNIVFVAIYLPLVLIIDAKLLHDLKRIIVPQWNILLKKMNKI